SDKPRSREDAIYLYNQIVKDLLARLTTGENKPSALADRNSALMIRHRETRAEFPTARVPSMGNHEFSGGLQTCQQGEQCFCDSLFYPAIHRSNF
ncbi:MAG: hypothetical protein KDA83_21380, partial [Planctomycetales bacterium]|nr:hypothetical protein [Planctomycetales bacterium]